MKADEMGGVSSTNGRWGFDTGFRLEYLKGGDYLEDASVDNVGIDLKEAG
jgi:hypothetical protein